MCPAQYFLFSGFSKSSGGMKFLRQKNQFLWNQRRDGSWILSDLGVGEPRQHEELTCRDYEEGLVHVKDKECGFWPVYSTFCKVNRRSSDSIWDKFLSCLRDSWGQNPKILFMFWCLQSKAGTKTVDLNCNTKR